MNSVPFRARYIAVPPALTTVTLFLSTIVHGNQAPQTKPTFDVVSVKRNTSGTARSRVGADGVRPNLVRFVATNAPARSLLLYAYPQLLSNQIVGAPAWIDTDRFDVEGKPATPVSPDQLRLMLVTLLEDRFVLKANFESRELPIYRLVSTSRPKIVRSVDQTAPPSGQPVRAGQSLPRGAAGMRAEAGGTVLEGMAVPISSLVGLLQTQVSRQLVDGTGLTGLFDFTLQLSPETAGPSLAPGDHAFPSVFSAVEQQLGLRLESSRGPVDVLVVTSMQKPSDN